MNVLRALLIGELDAQSVRDALRSSGGEAEIAQARSRESLIAALDSSWDLAVADLDAAGMGVAEAAGILRARDSGLQLVLLAPQIDAPAAVEALRAGAADVIRWGDWARLAAVAQRESGAARARRQERQSEEIRLQTERLAALSSFAGGVAHDFNNFLTVARGYSNLILSEGGLTSSQREEIEEIQKAALSAMELTHVLQAVGGRTRFEPCLIGLNAFLEDLRGILQESLPPNVRLSMRLEAANDAVSADRAALRDVLRNLVRDAGAAMPDGGAVVIVTLNPDSGGSVTLAISDTGEPLDADILRHAYEPYFQSERTGRRKCWGLPLASAFVRRCGGSIDLVSEPGKGGCVSISLPLSGTA